MKTTPTRCVTQGTREHPGAGLPGIKANISWRGLPTCERRFPDMDEQLLRVTVGAVAVYGLRLTDIHLRELIMILWIVDGESHMRCQHGNIYFFHNGAFTVHRGVPPQGALARCKNFFLRLEGLFRLMGSPRLLTDGDVLDHVHRLFVAQNSSAQSLLNACEDAAKNHIPSVKSRQARSSRALEADEDVPQQDGHAQEGPTSRCQSCQSMRKINCWMTTFSIFWWNGARVYRVELPEYRTPTAPCFTTQLRVSTLFLSGGCLRTTYTFTLRIRY